MGRPKTVRLDTFHLYDKFHSQVVKMYNGVELTALFPMKETALYHVSCEVWAFCASKIKLKKPKPLSVNIPVLSDEKVLTFLEKHCWGDWLQRKKDNTDFIETIAQLRKLFPTHEFKYFYELNSLVSTYCHGTFLTDEPKSEHRLSNQMYYNSKYNRGVKNPPHVQSLFDEYQKAQDNKLDAKKVQAKFDLYYDAFEKYLIENHNIIDTLKTVAENTVCMPMAFSDNTAEWSREKYGKLLGYAHAGEVFFIVTPTTIYFEVTRHF